MASRSTPARRRAGAQTGRPAGSVPPAALFVGGAAVVVVILFLVLSNRTSRPANAGQGQPAAKVGAATPAPAPASSPVQLAGAKGGKTPDRPAPPLTAATLQQLKDLLGRITALRNEAVTARTGSSDVQLARAKMGEAKVLLDEWEAKVKDPLRWQEDAQMDEWAQPAEYMTLETLYATYQRLNNEVRKGGG